MESGSVSNVVVNTGLNFFVVMGAIGMLISSGLVFDNQIGRIEDLENDVSSVLTLATGASMAVISSNLTIPASQLQSTVEGIRGTETTVLDPNADYTIISNAPIDPTQQNQFAQTSGFAWIMTLPNGAAAK